MILIIILVILFAFGLVAEFALEIKAQKEQEERTRKYLAQPLVWCEMLQRWQ